MTPPRTPIFLLSPPRSGSTLVQRVLAAHPEIATAAESWVLLAPLYALREGAYAEYRHFLARIAVDDFCSGLPQQRDDYLRAVRAMALHLYAIAGGKPTARYFLDKTPSYSLVVDDIARAFPEAKLVFLWRNPLAVVASEVATFRRQRWRLHHVRVQLYEGMARLVEAARTHADRSCTVQYERLITQPEQEWARLFSYLDVKYDPGVLERFAVVELRGRVQDSAGARRYSSLSTEPLNTWKDTLASPVRRAWCRRYLRWLGQDRLAAMGFDLDSLLAELGTLRTNAHRALPDAIDALLSRTAEILEPRLYREKLRAVVRGQRIYQHE